jgi:hypothetical protein
VNGDEVATPLELVVSVSVAVPLVVNTPLAPAAGAVKVTDTPLAGDPPEVTVATSGAPNPAPTAALCGVPLVAVIATTGVGVVFELELQPARKATVEKVKVERTNAGKLQQALRNVIGHLR